MKNTDLEIMKKCPRYNRCSASICPLDADKDLRVSLPDDAKCELSKTQRIRLGEDLPWKGLLPRELAGHKNWNSKSTKEKIQLSKNLPLLGKNSRFVPRGEKQRDKND